MPKVTVIPPTINPLTHLPSVTAKKRRVAGYARVSTDSDEQFTSYEAQVDYYTKFIQSKPDWEFVKVYTDEGISGTNTKKREGFKKMVADALAGKIDLIVTKSVSRFARNTVDSLVTIRKMKENGVECYFEKEGIYTFDGKGELLITIMSSLAQEESRSISENVTWGQRKRFADGKVSMPYRRFLGYEKGEDGRPVIVEKEASIVKLIYRLFLDGKTSSGICKYLESLSIPSPGGSSKWSKTTVDSILTNEKYKGDALLQKKFTVDFLQKKLKPNEGEVPQYYVEGSHPAIINPDEWDHVQVEFDRRKQLGQAYSGKSILSTKLVCADCGGYYGQKVWHSTDQYRRVIWQCNSKFDNGKKCGTPVLDTDTIQAMFIKSYNRLMEKRSQVIADCELMRRSLTDFDALDAEIAHQLEETEVVAELVKAAVKENASTVQLQDEYLKKYSSLNIRYEEAVGELEKLKDERTLRQQQDKAMALFIRTLKKQPLYLYKWDDTIWTVMVEKGIVHRDKHITFVFYNGTEIEVGAE
ncbi:MAG: recombinase family protein [Clostridia bacterium]|nr:recombinase family protein [Clostridia bacterium]